MTKKLNDWEIPRIPESTYGCLHWKIQTLEGLVETLREISVNGSVQIDWWIPGNTVKYSASCPTKILKAMTDPNQYDNRDEFYFGGLDNE